MGFCLVLFLLLLFCCFVVVVVVVVVLFCLGGGVTLTAITILHNVFIRIKNTH